jgi:hypothetical protein
MTYVYIEGNPKHTSGPNGTVTRVVIHATCSGTHDNGARENAHYFQGDSAGGLAHYVVDPHEVVQCAHEDVATWHAPPNKGSIGVELCDPQAGDGKRWADADHESMLRLAAKLVADVCARHKLPVAFVDAAGLKAGHTGITTHHEVSKAFGESTHSDPDVAGPFPLQHFLALVHAASAPPPAPAKAPAKPKPAPLPRWYKRQLAQGAHGDDVKVVQRKVGAVVDGSFGPNTKHAVAHFQNLHVGLLADGVVGERTARVLGN